MAALLTAEDDAALQRWFHQEAAKSCVSYCANVIINSSPPKRFDCIVEPWQAGIIGMLSPAVEYTAGLRLGYDGPRRFFIVIPKGHDKTSLIGRLATWALGYSRLPLSASSSAGDKDQARLVREAMDKELAFNPWVPVTLSNYQAKGPGGTLDILSADAPTSSGRFDDLIVMDELTFWKRRDLFDVLISGAHKRPRSTVIVITNAGIRGSWQWQVLDAIRHDPLWKVYETPPGVKLATWLSDAEIASQRAVMTRNYARRVYDNVWVDSSDNPLLSWELITGCHADSLWPGGFVPRGYNPGPLYVGVDIGRSHDLTVILTLEDCGKIVKVREVKVLDGVPFEGQEAEIDQRLTQRVKAAKIDKGGIGMQLAEKFERRYPGKVEGVACSTTWQGQAAVKLHTRFAQQAIEIPNDPDLNVDLQKVEEIGTSKGGVPVLNTISDSQGHADRFWALALAIDCVPVVAKRKFAVGI